MTLRKLKKRSLNKGFLTIEASFVFIIFFAGYIFLNSFILSSFVESTTKKAINSTALDLSVYAEISDNFKVSDLLVVNDNGPKANDLIAMIGKSLSKKMDKNELDKLSTDSLSFMKSKLKNKISNQALQSLLRKLVTNKLGGDEKVLLFGVEKGTSGLDFSGSKLLDNGLIEINLKYKLLLKALNIFTHKRIVCQKAYIETNIKPYTFEDDSKDTIWNETNFNRGRFFANYLRENASSLVVRSGQGLDLYNKESKMVSQMFSMNIFKNTYSEKKGDNYQLNMGGIKKQIDQYCKKAKEHLLKSKGRLTLDNNQIINVDLNSNIELILIMPNEAKSFSELRQLSGTMPQGFSLKIVYMEDALS